MILKMWLILKRYADKKLKTTLNHKYFKKHYKIWNNKNEFDRGFEEPGGLQLKI